MTTEFAYARPRVFLPFAALLLVCGAHQSQATNALDASQRVVTISDLDLSHSVDIERLHRRITQAAREVCRTAGVLETLRRSHMHECARETIAHTVATLNLPRLTAHHQRKLATNAASRASVRLL